MTSGTKLFVDVHDHSTWKTDNAEKIAIRWLAQDGVCPICGKGMPPTFALGHGSYAASLDHVFSRYNVNHVGRPRPPGLGHRRAGRRAVNLTVAVHRKCNSRKGHRYPTGCEMIWLMAVNARLVLDRPSSRWISQRQSLGCALSERSQPAP